MNGADVHEAAQHDGSLTFDYHQLLWLNQHIKFQWNTIIILCSVSLLHAMSARSPPVVQISGIQEEVFEDRVAHANPQFLFSVL